MAVAMTFGLFIVISFFSHTSVRLSEKRLLAMAEEESAKMSKAIKSSLDTAMLNNEEGGVQGIIDALGQESMVRDIKIIDLNGEVKRAKTKADIGIVLDQGEKSCALCHAGSQVSNQNLSVLFTLNNGTRILRNVNPIENEDRCHGCHDPQSRILGKLLVDFTTDDIEKMVVDNRKVLILSAVATLFTSVLLCFLLATVLVKNPLRNLLIKMKAAEGDMDQQEYITGEDEIDVLDSTYDSLMTAIEERNQKIEQQMNELLALYNVSEILNKSTSIEDNVDLILKALQIGFHVEKCAILLLDGPSSFELKGCLGQDRDMALELTDYLASPEQLEKIMQGNTFMAQGCGENKDAFLVVPLKAANTIIGVIAVCSVTGTEITADDLQKSFAIIATSLAPHFQIGLSQTEKQEMQISPFNSFISSVDNEIENVREYMGSLSLGTLKVTNYQDLCQTKGVEQASHLVQETASQFSANLSAVHQCTRLSEDVIAVILPMLDSFEATDAVQPVLSLLKTEAQLDLKLATFPDNGENGLELLHILQG